MEKKDVWLGEFEVGDFYVSDTYKVTEGMFCDDETPWVSKAQICNINEIGG